MGFSYFHIFVHVFFWFIMSSSWLSLNLQNHLSENCHQILMFSFWSYASIKIVSDWLFKQLTCWSFANSRSGRKKLKWPGKLNNQPVEISHFFLNLSLTSLSHMAYNFLLYGSTLIFLLCKCQKILDPSNWVLKNLFVNFQELTFL